RLPSRHRADRGEHRARGVPAAGAAPAPGAAAEGSNHRNREERRRGHRRVSLPQPSDRPQVDEIVTSVRRILSALGEDPDRDGLDGTPRRGASSLLELTDGYGIEPREVVRGALYAHQGDDPVAVHGIPFYSLCEHH